MSSFIDFLHHLQALQALKVARLRLYTYANNQNELRFHRDGETTPVTVKGLLDRFTNASNSAGGSGRLNRYPW